MSRAHFAAALRSIARESEAESPAAIFVREVFPPPVLCPEPGSLVRYMPLAQGDPSPNAGALRIWMDDGRWTFVDFAAFAGEDFGYAVCRCLLHRLPSRQQIEVARSGSAGERLRLLLEADSRSRRTKGPGRLVGLSEAKMLDGLRRMLQKLRLRPLASAVRLLIDAYARHLFAKNQDQIVQRRLLLGIIDLLSRKS